MRPTSDRVRESLFARLEPLDDARVLDLYAGSGALGFEALSRGAREVCFVERSAPVRKVLRENIEALDQSGRVRIERGDAVVAIGRLEAEGLRFDLALLDPPYAASEAPRAMRALAASGILASDALVIVESGRHHPLPAIDAFECIDERLYGDTILTWFAAIRGDGDGAGGGGDEA